MIAAGFDRRRRAAMLAASLLVFVFVAPVAGETPAGALATQLRRYPYVTDVVGSSAAVSWMTDRSSTIGTLRWGPVDGDGTCNLTQVGNATRIAITINGVPIYQWKALVALGSPGAYCYRPYLGSVDLLEADASPVFTAQVEAGSTEAFSFAVFGDWGQVDAGGANPAMADLLAEVKASGARFAVTTGDNAYPSGSQQNYGDLQTSGAATSAVFGPSYWGTPGQMPLFPTLGNHGVARSDAFHPQIMNFPQDVAAATSGGRYVKDTYCCVNGTFSQIMASGWYAFDAGSARFYVLDAAWPDMNVGDGTTYSDDYAAHWTPGTPQYEWLQADLAAHPGTLKFAFFHFPLYSDQRAEGGDTYLQGPESLEGLLSDNGVRIAFNGHAHTYQRNTPSAPGGLVSYVTGGGGAALQSIGELGCSPTDAYGIGWSNTHGRGNACGAAPVPTSPAQVTHFLLVTVDGTNVTVTPTDALGNTFDEQTYAF